MKQRLFFALPLSSGLLKKIAFLEKRIEEKTKINFPWISLKNLHLTIIFLGYLNYEDYLKIEEILKDLNWGKRFEVKIKKIDYGPPNHRRMIWLYLEKNQDLENFKKMIDENIQKAQIHYHREDKEFLPHINLARLNNVKNFPEIKEELNWQVVFNELVLYESVLKFSGAEYEKLLKLSLDSRS